MGPLGPVSGQTTVLGQTQLRGCSGIWAPRRAWGCLVNWRGSFPSHKADPLQSPMMLQVMCKLRLPCYSSRAFRGAWGELLTVFFIIIIEELRKL